MTAMEPVGSPDTVRAHAFSARSAMALLAVLGVAAGVVPALAQTTGAPPAGQQQGQPAAGAGKALAAEVDSELKQRVDRLEEQLLDMQVVIGTLQSMSASGGVAASGSAAFAGPPAAPGGAGDAGRLDAVETRIGALTSHLQQLTEEVRSLSGGAPRATGPDPAAAPPRAAAGGFASPTVTTETEPDPIGGLITDSSQDLDPAAAQPAAGAAAAPPGDVAAVELAPPPVAIAPVGAPPADAKQAYNTAHGYLLNQDFGAAQAAFKEFLKNFPNDKQAPSALYWLGEIYYVQKNFADAAEAFDLVTTTYGNSIKAPDAQLKRGMALSNLGKTNEACTAFRTLAAKYPNAPDGVKSKADSERKRVGCT